MGEREREREADRHTDRDTCVVSLREGETKKETESDKKKQTDRVCKEDNAKSNKYLMEY